MKKMALLATLHCLIGCAVGEMIGVTIGTHSGMEMHQTIILAAVLSFVCGYAFSTWPLVRHGMKFLSSLKLVFAADTLSILAMTVADNMIMVTIPGAMEKDLTHPIYWGSRIFAIIAAFIVAFPVNSWLLKKGKGHALMHEHMHGRHHTEE
jgi:putative flippase GtrA